MAWGAIARIVLKNSGQEINMQTKIIYEDNYIMVIHKPAGIAVQSARIGQVDVCSELKKYLAVKQASELKTAGGKQKVKAGSEPYLGIIHRLDQPVEGVLVFAKNQSAATALNRQLQGEDFCKEYLAVVCGKMENTSGELVDYLGKENGVAVVTEKEKGKKAVLEYELQAEIAIDGEILSLLYVKLKTGRFHQIRVQFAHAGHPLLGDKKYGTKESLSLSEKQGVRNVALCAKSLSFVHPVKKEKLEYSVSPTNVAFVSFLK